MLRLVARVSEVRNHIHRSGTVEHGEFQNTGDLPRPDRVEIRVEGERTEPCMMYRWSKAGDYCGDTWHQTLDDAFQQANYEYGLTESDFLEVRS